MIETDRLILRPWRETMPRLFISTLLTLQSVWLQVGLPHTSVENSSEIIRTVFSAPETYAVVLKETDEPVGCCGIMFSNSLHAAEMQTNEAEIGYWIGKPYWGQGLIPEGVKALLSRCFNDLELGAVWCGYMTETTNQDVSARNADSSITILIPILSRLLGTGVPNNFI